MLRANGVEVLLLALELGEGAPMIQFLTVKALGGWESCGCGGEILIRGFACLNSLLHGTDVLEE